MVLAVYARDRCSAGRALRLPETLHPEYRRSLRAGGDRGGAIGASLTEPAVARLYAGADRQLRLPDGLYLLGPADRRRRHFTRAQYIGLVFAAVAAPMALASWLNSRVVGRFGLRRVGHLAARGVRDRHRSSTRRSRLAGIETLWMLHRPAGADDVLLRLHLVEPRHAGDGPTWRRSPGRHRRSRASSGPSAARRDRLPDRRRSSTAPPTRSCSAPRPARVAGFIVVVLTEPKRLFAGDRPSAASRQRPRPAKGDLSPSPRGACTRRPLPARGEGRSRRLLSRRRLRRGRPSALRRLPRSCRGWRVRGGLRRRGFP